MDCVYLDDKMAALDDPMEADSPSPPPAPPLELTFEDEQLSLTDVIQRVPFPVVAVCDSSKCPIPLEKPNLSLDLRQPLLFYRKRNIQKIPARSMFFDDSQKEYKEIGEPLLIPEDYKGFFAILKRRSTSKIKNESTPYFCSVEEMAASDTEQFLIGGQNKVKAKEVIDKNGDNVTHQDKFLFPGDILRRGKIFVFETKIKRKGIMRRPSIVSEKFLSCTDETDKEILLPFTETGCFYSLSSASGKLSCPVMQMGDIVAQKCLPCVVKLVYGRVPSAPCFFSGLLKLESAFMERSIVASTITNKRNILVEFPSNCDLNFNIAIPNEKLFDYQGYKDALSICSEKSCSYMQNMKVCLGAYPLGAEYRRKSSHNSLRHSRVSCSSSEECRFNFDELSSPGSSARGSDSSFGDSGYVPLRASGDFGPRLMTQRDSVGDTKGDNYDRVKFFVENSLYEIPVTNDVDDWMEEKQTQQTKRPKSVILDILLGPPPDPCEGPAPSPCYGTPITDVVTPEGVPSLARRPSTFVFAESSLDDVNEEDDVTASGERRGSEPAHFPGVSNRRQRRKNKVQPKHKDDSVVPIGAKVPNTIQECPPDQGSSVANVDDRKSGDDGLEEATADDQAETETPGEVNWIVSQRSSTTEDNSEYTSGSNRSSDVSLVDVNEEIRKMSDIDFDRIINEMSNGCQRVTETLDTVGNDQDRDAESERGAKTPSLFLPEYDDMAPPMPHLKDHYEQIWEEEGSTVCEDDDLDFDDQSLTPKSNSLNRSTPFAIPPIPSHDPSSKQAAGKCLHGEREGSGRTPPPCLPKPFRRASCPPVPPKPCKASRDRAVGEGSSPDVGQLESCPARIDVEMETKNSSTERAFKEAAEALTKEQLNEALREQGVKTPSRDYVTGHMTVREFLTLNLEELEHRLPGIGRTDVSKIAMFIRSWKLNHI